MIPTHVDEAPTTVINLVDDLADKERDTKNLMSTPKPKTMKWSSIKLVLKL